MIQSRFYSCTNVETPASPLPQGYAFRIIPDAVNNARGRYPVNVQMQRGGNLLTSQPLKVTDGSWYQIPGGFDAWWFQYAGADVTQRDFRVEFSTDPEDDIQPASNASGFDAPGVAPTVNPVYVGGIDTSGNIIGLKLGPAGRPVVAGLDEGGGGQDRPIDALVLEANRYALRAAKRGVQLLDQTSAVNTLNDSGILDVHGYEGVTVAVNYSGAFSAISVRAVADDGTILTLCSGVPTAGPGFAVLGRAAGAGSIAGSPLVVPAELPRRISIQVAAVAAATTRLIIHAR